MSDIALISYCQATGSFIRVRALTQAEVYEIIEEISKKFKSKWKLEDYLIYIVNKLVINVEGLTKSIQSSTGSGSKESVAVALFPNVIDIHPMFSVDTVCDLVNEELLKDTDMETEVSKSNEKTKSKPLSQTFEQVRKRIIGQDKALDEIEKLLKLQKSGLESFVSMFFIGPTGVGKTETAKLIAEKCFGSKEKLIKINCSELASQHEYSVLIGAPPGFVGHGEKSLLAEKSEGSNEWVFLFDEFEKAHPKLQSFLLGLLDDGKIMDKQGKLLDFSKSIFIFTTNVGVKKAYDTEIIGFSSPIEGKDKSKDVIVKEFEDEFSPEFRNRLNAIVFFSQLSKADAKEITKIHLEEVPIRRTEKLINYIVDNSFSEKYGARNIKRFISNSVKLPIAERILSGTKAEKYKAVFDGSSLKKIE